MYSDFEILKFIVRIEIFQQFQNTLKRIFFFTSSFKRFRAPIMFQNVIFIFQKLFLSFFLDVPGQNQKQFNALKNSIFYFIHLFLLVLQKV